MRWVRKRPDGRGFNSLPARATRTRAERDATEGSVSDEVSGEAANQRAFEVNRPEGVESGKSQCAQRAKRASTTVFPWFNSLPARARLERSESLVKSERGTE